MNNLLHKSEPVRESRIMTGNASRKVTKSKRVCKPIGHVPTSWSDKLARAVEQFPYLYDRHDFFYKNSTKKELAWKKVGAQVGVSGTVAKAKWTIGRSNYGRFMRALERAPSEVAHVAAYYESFRFLDRIDRRIASKTRGNGWHNRSTSVESMEHDYAESSIDQRDTYSSEGESYMPLPEQPASKTVTIDARAMNTFLDRLEPTTQSPDALELMFMSFAAMTRQFKPAVQSQIKLKVMQVMVDAEAEMA
ncbi:uncharacterized protein LOC126572749 [Anopheles aquasalis]|uniref:uncharacterized protein LOC126572749 n=1 Tax=Anopheles aquasalis TaxID=42839 RepID=UPI00215B70A3|nr:uncharacterized protein LOC126572749 [Anopheles aquasalis]XP_050088296.1 uncharacterized protein LOC126572749 [Anopheles aquasalis]XP_050088298.1 uncharacterized protein LOC126572749 [Anopheles aquasalis]XP_050088299.1 uncharacterized protein LOC126572749 [Anopheles aquasalis]